MKPFLIEAHSLKCIRDAQVQLAEGRQQKASVVRGEEQSIFMEILDPSSLPQNSIKIGLPQLTSNFMVGMQYL